MDAHELSVLFPPVLRLELPTPLFQPSPAGARVDSGGGGGVDDRAVARAALYAAYPWLRCFNVVSVAPPPPLPLPFENPPRRYDAADHAFVASDRVEAEQAEEMRVLEEAAWLVHGWQDE